MHHFRRHEGPELHHFNNHTRNPPLATGKMPIVPVSRQDGGSPYSRDSRSIGNWQHWLLATLATFPHWQHSSRPLAHAEELEGGAEVGRERGVRLDLRALHHAPVQVKRVARISAPRRNYLVY